MCFNWPQVSQGSDGETEGLYNSLRYPMPQSDIFNNVTVEVKSQPHQQESLQSGQKAQKETAVRRKIYSSWKDNITKLAVPFCTTRWCMVSW